MFATAQPTTCVLEFEWEDDDFILESKSTAGNSNSNSKHTIISVGKHGTSKGRMVAGYKRAMNAQVNALMVECGGRDVIRRDGGVRENVMQSISAMPGLGHLSFEELRVECYLQSLIARDETPAPVDALATPWAVIQPIFKEISRNEQELGMCDCNTKDDSEMVLGDIEPLEFRLSR